MGQKFFRQIAEEYSLVAFFSALFILLSLTVPYFFSPQNMIGLALSVSQIGMAACTMMFCLAARDFDLSIGSIVAFSGVCCALLLNATDSLWLSIALAIIASSAIGWLNGTLISYLHINALIATLATMQIVRGLAFIISGGQAVGVTHVAFHKIGIQMFFGVPLPIWITIICFIIFGVLLNKTIYGRNTLAIGGNPDAARLAGVHVEKTRVCIFMIQGAIAGLAGIILAARMTSGQPNAGQGFELSVISACVLGRVSLMGGRATIGGVIAGVLIMGTVENVMSLLNIDAFYQYVVRGTMLLLAVLIDQAKNRLSDHLR